MKLSVIITTKNRPLKLQRCIAFIQKNLYTNTEIIIVDESGEEAFRANRPTGTKRHPISHIKSHARNLSEGRNEGIKRAKGDILIFTDDDCIVSPNWLTTIARTFSVHPDVAAVFGATKAFHPSQHKHFICPCTTPPLRAHLIQLPTAHRNAIGFGNNMAYRSNVFTQHGQFKPWLGAGSITGSAEDAEFALRLLICAQRIYFEPAAIVYHDKWLTPLQSSHADILYTRGEMACYGYYYFQGYRFAKQIVKQNVLRFPKHIADKFISHRRAVSISYELSLFKATWGGLIIGWCQSLFEPLHGRGR